MLIALLIAGIGFLLAGLLGIAFGIPIKEFSFGNTEILAGVIAACTGTIMLGLWIVARQLKGIAQLLGSGGAATPTPRSVLLPAAANPALRDQTSEDDGLLFNQPGASHPADAEPAPPPSAPPPWHEETAARDRGRSEMPPVLPTPEPAPAVKPKRNLLFSSTSRRERERAEGRTDSSIADSPPAPAGAPPPAKPNEPPPATFEDAWPQSERARTPDVRRSGRSPSTLAEDAAAADRDPPAPQNDEPPPVTVLKSGVVDGMAYSLYSDGSIEAQMPEGMMRFASIDELRAHLDQRA